VYLTATNRSSFELKIVGYEFPELADVEYDSNWLEIAINVCAAQGAWTATHPSLLTYEVEHLADWFEGLAEGRPVDDKVHFIEPNLSFEVQGTESEKRLRVYFELESRPSWAPWEGVPQKNLWVQFPLSEIDLLGAAQSLRTELSRFPQRTAR
jgi:hypothetical protein